MLAIGAFVNVKLTARRERRVLRDLPRIFESVHAVELLSSKDQRDELERICTLLLDSTPYYSLFRFIEFYSIERGTGESIQSTTLSVLQRFGVLSFPSVRKPEGLLHAPPSSRSLVLRSQIPSVV